MRWNKDARSTQEQRIPNWQFDQARLNLRLSLRVMPPASNNNPSALLHALQKGLMDASLPVAMGFEKRPRPMVTLGPPLPVGVPGFQEWADLVLSQATPLAKLPDRVNPHLPEGLSLLKIQEVPAHSSSALELACEARWLWEGLELLRSDAQEKIHTFLDAESFQIEKQGKCDGHKSIKKIEVRHMVLDMQIIGAQLFFSTVLHPGEALNPARLLGGIFGVPHQDIRHLTRLEVILKADERLQDSYKFETKLHNIYEDAVLLGAFGCEEIPRDDQDGDNVTDDDGLLMG